MNFERTLVLVKPHAVRSRWTNPIFERYLDAGLRFGDLQVLTLSAEEATTFYAEHEGKPFFPGLIEAMCEGPLVGMIFVGENAIARVRELNGATNPAQALPGSIRHDFKGSGGPYNTVHGSDSAEAVERETRIIFGE